MKFSPDGRYVSAVSWDEAVWLWDVQTGQRVYAWGHRQAMGAVFSPDGSQIVSYGYDLVRVWDTATHAEIAALDNFLSHLFSSALSSSGALLATNSDFGRVQVWNVMSGEELATFYPSDDPGWGVAFSPDGLRVVSGGNYNTVYVWNLDSGTQDRVLTGEARVFDLAFSGSRLVAGSTGGTVQMWNMTTGHLDAAWVQGNESDWCGDGECIINSVAFSPDGSLVAGGSDDGTVWVWEVETGEVHAALNARLDWPPVRSVTFSPDGSLIAAAHATSSLDPSSPADIQVWDAVTGHELFVLHAGPDHLNSLAFSPDGSMLASLGDDGQLRLWNVAARTQVAALPGHTMWGRYVGFTPDGTRLISTGLDGTIRIWGIP
jgi:Tol biopolymer transport system component